ncbi:MAG: hypothetical protein ACT4P6_07870, partial [Gemmatimonadaceae bacterium]
WQSGWYDRHTRRVRDLSCGPHRIYLAIEIRRVACRRCRSVKQEQLDFLADHPFYTKRFAFWVGRRSRAATIQDVAREAHLLGDPCIKPRLAEPQIRHAGRQVDRPCAKRNHLVRASNVRSTISIAASSPVNSAAGPVAQRSLSVTPTGGVRPALRARAVAPA